MMRQTNLLAAALLLAGAAGAAPGETEAPLTLQGAGPYYRLTLPAALYGRASHSDLRDLRIRNGAGNPVPWAWLQEPAQAARIASQKAPLFALPASAGTAPAEALASLKLRSDGSLVLARPAPAPNAAGGWIVDLSRLRGNLQQIRFDIAPSTSGVFGYRLEASDDLRDWRALGGEEQLVRLSHSGAHIERLAADLGGVRARFLRLRWSDPANAAALTGASVDSEQSSEVAPAQEWSGALAPERCAENSCDYLLPRGLPVRSLRIALADSNTFAQLEVLGLAEAGATPATSASRPLLRHAHNPLYLLRQQRAVTRPPAAAAPDEVALADAVVYRLTQGASEARSPDIALDGAVWQRLRLRTAGPIGLLGATPPTIEVATTPRSLLFLAQGQPPFQLAWRGAVEPAAAPASGAAFGLATLVPGYATGKPLLADTASVALPPPAAAPVVAPAATAATADTQAGRSAWLWAALAGGLLLLAGMAWSLFASMKKGA